jgi:hypothetical protein
MKRPILIAFLLAASQPLLVGGGILTKWTIECAGGACAGTVRASSPFGPPRDMLLTVLAVTAPYLLAVLVTAVMWLLTTLTSQAATQPVAELSPASSARLAVDHALAGGTRERQGLQRIAAAFPYAATNGSVPTAGASRPLAQLGAQHAGSLRK